MQYSDNNIIIIEVTEDVHKCDTVSYKLDGTYYEIQASQDIPVYHKIARCALAAGSLVVKYGQIIGVAVSDINEGEHVHPADI